MHPLLIEHLLAALLSRTSSVDATAGAEGPEAPATSDDPATAKPKEPEDPQVAAAKEEAKDAKAEAEEAKADLAALKAGKLVRFGVTGGIGPIVTVPLHRAEADGVSLAPTTALGTMPFVLFLPRYWRGSTPEQNIYCSNHWAGKDAEDSAQIAADDAAKKRAERRVRVLKAAVVAKSNAEKNRAGASAPVSNVLTVPSAGSRRQRRIRRDLYALADVLDDELGGDGALPRWNERVSRAKYVDGQWKTRVGRGPVAFEDKVSAARQWAASSSSTTAFGRARWLARRIEKALEKEQSRNPDFYAATRAAIGSWGKVGLHNEIVASLSVGVHGSDYGELDGVTTEQWAMAEAITRVEAAGGGGDKRIEFDKSSRTIDQANDDLAMLVQSTSIKWRTGVPAKCARYKFGMYFGYPLKFDVTVPVQHRGEEAMRRRVTVTEIASAGLGISPNAYISILTGLSVGVTNIPPGDNDREVVFGFVFGLGGNLDLITLLKGG